MKAETYWPKDKLYLYATCALFPDRLINKVLSSQQLNDYIPYYWEVSDQTKVLEQMEQDQLLDFTVTRNDDDSAEYVINKIDRSKFLGQLKEYLESYRNDELIGDPASKPDGFTVDNQRLKKYLTRSTREEPVVNPMNIWESWTAFNSQNFPFWEVVLTSELILNDIKTIKIGLELIENRGGTVPYVKVALLRDVRKSSHEISLTKHRAILLIKKVNLKTRKLIAQLDNGEEFILSGSLRTDLAPQSLMKYLIDNPGKSFDIDFIRKSVEGCEYIRSLSETLRQCGFDAKLKEHFFDECAHKKVQLKSESLASIDDFGKPTPTK